MDIKTAKLLTDWYRKEKRPLPWRGTGNPEDVWISEIMLQQTRIEAVKDYFTRFRKALPDIKAIASCPDDALMKLWEGLGYYSRARNLKKCAVVCLQKYNGQIPADYDALLSLPGIGAYTAGAVASIAFGIPVPAVDGNVLRVLSRLSGSEKDVTLPETKKKFTEELQSLLNDAVFLRHSASSAKFSVSDFNQALMELGEVLCIPNGEPLCGRCPVRKNCIAAEDHSTDRIPVRSPKKKRRIENRTLFVIRDGDKFLFRKRPAKGLLAGLYEFPGEEGFLTEKEALSFASQLGTEPLRIRTLPEAKHIFTHIEWHMHAWEIRVSSFSGMDEDLKKEFRFVTKKELQNFAVPSAFRTYVDYYALRD